MIDNTKEYILCAAIWYANYDTVHKPHNVDSGIVISGVNHAQCIGVFNQLTGKRTPEETTIQGFITSKNRFVDRKEGSAIAFNANQTKEDDGCLFSEDLYPQQLKPTHHD